MKRFLIIFALILLVQVPGWYLILGRDSGAIDDFGNEKWIMIYDWGATLFSFPLYFFLQDRIESFGLAFVIYLLDLFIISLTIHYMVHGLVFLRKRLARSKSTTIKFGS